MNGDENAQTDTALLELLLTYAIPQKDVQPLAEKLIRDFGGLSGVLGAEVEQLCMVDGIKGNSAVLLKLVNYLRGNTSAKSVGRKANKSQPIIAPLLFEPREESWASRSGKLHPAKPVKKAPVARRGTGLFGKSILKEAIEMLPRLPNTESVDEIKEYLKKNLHFSAEQTRRRNADYIVNRMFPSGRADQALRGFARKYEGRQELSDACFYRFCKAEPVMYKVIDDLFIPSIGAGRLSRERLRDYLSQQFQTVKSIKDYAQAMIEALADSSVATADRSRITFSYREILIPSFAFVVHSEFPESGMYPIDQLENSPALRAMFWNPDRVLTALYELRNLGLIAKISEIDTVRQFTTKWNLEQLVERLVSERASA